MLIWLVAASAAFAAKKPQVDADVVVSREIAAPADVLFERVTDLEQWPALFPEPCASDWQIGLVSKGVGATAEVTYHFGPMHRSLDLELIKAEAPYVMEVNHLRKLGFVTQFVFADTGSGTTKVTLTTPLYEPPWPLRKVFQSTIRPAWTACYTQVLERLAAP
jgi:hypothetical protein